MSIPHAIPPHVVRHVVLWYKVKHRRYVKRNEALSYGWLKFANHEADNDKLIVENWGNTSREMEQKEDMWGTLFEGVQNLILKDGCHLRNCQYLLKILISSKIYFILW